MTICYFGNYNPEYNRTKVILLGLERLGVSVLHCRTQLLGLRGLIDLWSKHRSLNGKYDILLVGFGDCLWGPVLASVIAKTPVVWEPLISRYDAWILDRKLAHQYSLKAAYYWTLDWLSSRVVDFIILDTFSHIKYFHKEFGVPMEKMVRAVVGANDLIYQPKKKPRNTGNFEVEFHGKYIPLHGSEVLVRAAKLLEDEDIHFTMIGNGQEGAKTRELAEKLCVKNVTFLPVLSSLETEPYVRAADLCVGHLGSVPRIERSAPNKLYEAAAAGRVSINVDSEAIRELFTPGVNIIGVRPFDAEDVARAIRSLKESGNAEEMGRKAYEVYRTHCTPEKIAKTILSAISEKFFAHSQGVSLRV